MKLLIVESPAKAKTINKYLGSDFKVISSYGHVRGLPSKEHSVKPDNNFEMVFEIDSKSDKHIKAIVELALKCNELYLATDPDREGEAISWHIAEILKAKKALPKAPIKRVVFYEITKTAVLDALKNARTIDMNLVHAQQARQALDYLVGFTLSPVLWRKLPGSRSAGRVQSAALRMICDREGEIEKFKSQEYWDIFGVFQTSNGDTFEAALTHFDGKKLEKFDIQNQEQASEIVNVIRKIPSFSVEEIDNKTIKRNPNAPFTTATLIQESSRKLGFSARKTAQIAQKLYEGISVEGELTGLITYMRTDSVNISEEARHQTTKLIQDTYGKKYLPEKPRVYKTKTKNAQEAHEAIRPTGVHRKPTDIKDFLDQDQFKLYNLIWCRLVASQMASAAFDVISATLASSNNIASFRASGSVLVFPGFYKVYKEDEDDSKEEKSKLLPPLQNKELLNLNSIDPLQHFTEPPPRYTEASLVKKMEELGVGRPSTYPSIIAIIQDREYVKLVQKRFFPEIKGRIVSAFLSTFFTKYTDYDFTANLENQLDNISNGEVSFTKVLGDFWNPFKEKTNEILDVKSSEILDGIEKNLEELFFPVSKDQSFADVRKCPKCDTGNLALKKGKFGCFIGCSNYPTCNYLKNIDANRTSPEISNSEEFPKLLGVDDQNREIKLCKGAYGLYIQAEIDGKNVKRASVHSNLKPEDITLEYAKKMISLPIKIGKHPESGLEIKANIGRFGPYIAHDKKFVSVKKHDIFDLTIKDCVTLIENKEKAVKKKKGEA